MPKQSSKEPSSGALLTIKDFIDNERMRTCLRRLESEFGANGKRPFIVSDTLDGTGNQYVNLVQKGGGVLGIALVGYTYVLEQMGIRFLRLAGTSAGAINTALMTVIGKKEDPKSEQVLDCICKLDFFNLVDGHPIARRIIKNFITHQGFSSKLKTWGLRLIITFGLLLTGDFLFLGLQQKYPDLGLVTGVFFVLTGVFLLMVVVLIAYSATLLKRLKNSGFGINPGDFFYDWIKGQLLDNGVKTVSDLNAKASADVPGIHLRPDNPESIEGLKGDVTFIASELVTENKIQFPAMCDLFRRKEDLDQLQPAGFVRASMAIPLFFESYFINDIPCTDSEVQKVWLDKFNESDPPQSVRFVDGGILSNFPIDIFFNPKITTPRLPSFGIDLDDSEPEDRTKHASGWSLLGYFGRVFNTIRYYYDKDFLLKNKMFEKGIGKVPLSKYNWLNFFLKAEEKVDMFLIGAEAATNFLIGFDWTDYKNTRIKTGKEIKKSLL